MTLQLFKVPLCSVFFLGAFTFGLTTSAGRHVAVKSNFSTPIRVLLDKSRQDLTLRSAKKSLYVKADASDRWTPLNSVATIQFFPNSTAIWVNQKPFQTNILYFRGGPQHTDPIQYGSLHYRGAIKVISTSSGLLVANVIPIDDYLQGTIGGEMSPLWEIEALKAQVIAARTYAMYMIQNPKNLLYDLESGVKDQVYLGAKAESERVRLAIESTKNQVLTQDNHPIKPFYHSRCGGMTEPAKQVWNTHSLEKMTSSVPCPYCQKFPFRWKTQFKAKNILSALKLPAQKQKPFQISLLNRSPSGRVREIAIVTDEEKHLINSEELRQMLGYSQIKSTHFEVSVDKDDVIFEGKGAGHGVGMCQWGAQFLAKQGKSYRDILAHYYPSLKLN